MVKSEYVPYRKFAFAEPENKDHALFSMAAIGYGILPWLSLYAFQPYTVKVQDTLGTSAAFGDPNVMLALAFKYDAGLRLVPEKESLDDLEDWHFSTWAASTIPLGPTESTDRTGAPFAPDMQNRVREPQRHPRGRRDEAGHARAHLARRRELPALLRAHLQLHAVPVRRGDAGERAGTYGRTAGARSGWTSPVS